MMGSCGVCCCWCCGDCFEYHRGEVMKVSRFAGSAVMPSSLSPAPRRPSRTHADSSVHYGSYHETRNEFSPRYSQSPSLPRAFAALDTLGPAEYQYENVIFGEMLEDTTKETFGHGYTHGLELLERERGQKVAGSSKRVSQQIAHRNRIPATSPRNSNWSLKQQHFFDKMSRRKSQRLVDSIYDDSTDSYDNSDVVSLGSSDAGDEVITRGPVSQSRSRSPYLSSGAMPSPSGFRGLPRSRMSGYSVPAYEPHSTKYSNRRTTMKLGGLTIPTDTLTIPAAYSFQQLKDEMADVTAEMETLEGGDDGKNNPKSKQMSIGRKKFNMDPKKGIEYLIDHGLLKNTPDDISKFLYNGEGLNKTAIGDYLGERHDFNQTVLDSFVALHNFTDLILVQALRQFLWSFRLPGEAQKIDRMMERFARHYCDLNPTIFKHPDTCFVLSFAIIMLNTSLHNPAVKDKQTLEQFINMNRGIDNGDDLPRELLESLYESIKTEPFKIPEDDGNDLMHTFFNPDREGWLWKQGGRYKSWKRRWFILNDNCLYYFEFTTDKEPRGIIPLENIEVREVHDRNKPHCFELYATSTDFIKACKTDSEGKVVEGKHTVYRMSAATHDEKEEWIKCIRQSISHNPFYDLLAKRKKNIQKNNS
ncbi:cytohesin-1 isoform X3 [Hyalella azteca]|uniref:Cytohesin-1 isoform X3 n=1 Tax=Hyalella azteca TaxID=294128 RepID=A0A8B7NKX3_HYAAZ|nr:cytohesin-1 isoform X3 [Hyalella azteca]